MTHAGSNYWALQHAGTCSALRTSATRSSALHRQFRNDTVSTRSAASTSRSPRSWRTRGRSSLHVDPRRRSTWADLSIRNPLLHAFVISEVLAASRFLVHLLQIVEGLFDGFADH